MRGAPFAESLAQRNEKTLMQSEDEAEGRSQVKERGKGEIDQQG